MNEQLRVLFVEDSVDDAELILREIERNQIDVEHDRVETADGLREALAHRTWDIIVSDYSMPTFSAPEALEVLHATGLDLPFIIVSGTIGEETAVDALKSGANDFLVKGRLARLMPAIRRELREKGEREKRRAAEEARRQSDRRYRQIVDTSQEGIWVIDASGRTTFLNQRMAEMLGGTVEGLADAPAAGFLYESWLGTDRAQRLTEVKLRRADKQEFWALVSTNPIVDEAGEPAGALVMASDLTERRLLQAQLMVSDRMVSIGMLAAGVAHEINNPLTAVLTGLELAIEDLKRSTADGMTPAKLGIAVEDLTVAADAALRVRDIVRDLKVLSRGTDEQKLGPVDVASVLDSAARLAWNEIRHRARLVKAYGTVPPVDADAARLGQVFLNLLVNAAQAIPEGHADHNEIRLVVRASSDGEFVEVDIVDTGSGMSSAVIQQLFTPFFTTKPVGVGTGLGLSICHRLITSFGGTISVCSEVGRGSTFGIRLRIAHPAPTPVPEAPPEAPAVPRRASVLVVDDEPLVGRMIARVLTDHDVLVTTSAHAALETIRSGRHFDLVLCDLIMPELTGMDLHAELLRTHPATAAAMVFLTGGAFTPRAAAFLDEVPNPHIEKPFNPQALRELAAARGR